MMDDQRVRVTRFLQHLSALTRAYDIRIGGCGCCGSPYLFDHTTRETIEQYLHWDGNAESYLVHVEPTYDDDDEEEDSQ